MPLSDHEQRLLDEIEQALYAEDPKFAAHVRSARSRTPTSRNAVLCGVGVVAGLGLIVAGVLAPSLVALSVLGFVLVVASCGWAAQLMRGRRRGSSARPAAGETDATPRPDKQSGLRTRMEDRLRRRFDEN